MNDSFSQLIKNWNEKIFQICLYQCLFNKKTDWYCEISGFLASIILELLYKSNENETHGTIKMSILKKKINELNKKNNMFLMTSLHVLKAVFNRCRKHREVSLVKRSRPEFRKKIKITKSHNRYRKTSQTIVCWTFTKLIIRRGLIF